MFVTLLFQIIKQILTSDKDNLSECKIISFINGKKATQTCLPLCHKLPLLVKT